MAVIVISLRTKSGTTLVVTVNEPGAKVQVLDENGKEEEPKIEVIRDGRPGTDHDFSRSRQT